MYLTANFRPKAGSEYARDYAALLDLYSTNFGQSVERPVATYWPHTIVPAYFRLKLLDARAFNHRDSDNPAPDDGAQDYTPLLTNLACAGAMSAYWPTMVMCQMLFPGLTTEELFGICERLRAPDDDLAGLVEDARFSAIMRWAKRIAQDPKAISRKDFAELGKAGLSPRDIARVTQTAAVQAHFAMVCSAAGVEAVIDGFLLPVKKFVELDPFVDGADDSLTCCLESEVSPSLQNDSKELISLLSDEKTCETACLDLVRKELGWLPNLLKVACHYPEFIERHLYALSVLDKPQTPEFDPRHHSIARYLVTRFHQCPYFFATTEQNLIDVDEGTALLAEVKKGNEGGSLSEKDSLVCALTRKLVCNAYRTKAQDVEMARSIMGWSDAGYVDFVNTVAIQDSFCRLVLALHVVPDDRLLRFPVRIPNTKR